ncbi:MAG: heavy-metal-associated domain-containing protein [Anaerolineae bacterium]|nr:heavy-metal-associated domain-containing protein [Anaerolineae bacterium]
METITLPVEGMVCPFCAAAVENILGSLDGVVEAKADYIKGLATVSYDPTRVTPTQMVEAINTKSFYRASLPRLEETTVEGTNRVNPLPFLVGGVLIVLLGVGTWWVTARRQAGRATKSETS